ncbi:hypothetical protein, membrane [gut metagenome]|uniref:Uncharacterized protein n=1 Tax=gut metagenome TaxID=749906 RepID=J9CBE5_9ZZZZ
MSTSWIIYIVVFLGFFACAMYALTAIDFAKFCKIQNMQKVYLLMFLIAVALAWMATEAVLTLTIRQGLPF